MSTKTISLQEANLISWFNGQLSVLEQQSGKRVEKLTLSIDRTVSNDISISLIMVEKDVPVVAAAPTSAPVVSPQQG